LADWAIKGLKMKDHPLLREVHIFILAHSPTTVRRHLPSLSREPSRVRGAALLWVWSRGLPNPSRLDPVNLDVYERAAPVLCKLATSDPTPTMRWMAARALTHFKSPSKEILPVMLSTLASATDVYTATDVAQWFGRFTPAPDRAVPALITAMELKENSVKNECANALRAYGPRARFAVEPLKTLAKTNHWPTSSSAVWALQAIDLEAGIK
jgi:HEAT repeat protein